MSNGRNPYSVLTEYELQYLVRHLIDSNKFHEAIEELTCFDYIIERLETLPDNDGVSSVGVDWEKIKERIDLEGNTSSWETFWTDNEHQLMRAEPDWPPHKIFLQLAWEHADDSPVTAEAKLWLEDDMCTWTWLRLKPGFKQSSYTRSGIEKAISFDDPPSCIAVTRSSDKMVIGTVGGILSVWNVETKECQLEIETCKHISAIAITDDGKRCISAHGGLMRDHGGGTLAVWNVETKNPKDRLICELDGHGGLIRNIAITPDGKWAISSGSDKKVRIWNIDAGECNCVLSVPGLNPTYKTCVAITSDGNYAIVGGNHEWAESASRDLLASFLKEINVGKSSAEEELDKLAAELGLDDDPDDDFAEGFLDAMDESLREDIAEVSAKSEDCFGPDFDEYTGEYLQLWDLKKSERIYACKDKMDNTIELTCIALTPDEKFIVTGENNELCIRKCKTLADVKKLVGHKENILAVGVSCDGKYIVSSSEDSIRLWNALTGQCLNSFVPYGGAEVAVFSPSGDCIIVLCSDFTLRFLNCEPKKCLESDVFEGHENANKLSPMITLALNNSEAKALSVDSAQRTVFVWNFSDINNQRFDVSECSKKMHTPKMAVSALTSKALCEYDENKFSLWDFESNSSPIPIEWPTTWVHSAGMSPDGKMVAIADDDATIRIWDTETNECIKAISGTLLRRLIWTGDSLDEIAYIILTNNLHTAIIFCRRYSIGETRKELCLLDLDNIKVRQRIECDDLNKITVYLRNEQAVCIAENFETKLFWDLKTGKHYHYSDEENIQDRMTCLSGITECYDSNNINGKAWGDADRDSSFRSGSGWGSPQKPAVQLKLDERFLWYGKGGYVYPYTTLFVDKSENRTSANLVCIAKSGFQIWANSILSDPILIGQPLFFEKNTSSYLPKLLDLVRGNQVVSAAEISRLVKDAIRNRLS